MAGVIRRRGGRHDGQCSTFAVRGGDVGRFRREGGLVGFDVRVRKACRKISNSEAGHLLHLELARAPPFFLPPACIRTKVAG